MVSQKVFEWGKRGHSTRRSVDPAHRLEVEVEFLPAGGARTHSDIGAGSCHVVRAVAAWDQGAD